MAARRQKSALILTGLDDVDAALKEIAVVAANRAARSGLTKGCRVLVKKMKANVPSRHKEIRKALGFRIGMEGKGAYKGVTTAKAGAAVGKSKDETRRLTDAEMAAQRKSRKGAGKKGVGIGARNIDWYIKGTKERQTKAGKRTGKMPPHPIVKHAMASGSSEVIQVIRQGTLEALDREVQKIGRKLATVS